MNHVMLASGILFGTSILLMLVSIALVLGWIK